MHGIKTTRLYAGGNRKKLAQTDSRLVQYLIALMDTKSLKVQCQAALALRNLASDGNGHLKTRSTQI